MERNKEQAAQSILASECRVFTMLLTGYEPNEYVQAKYVEAHHGPLGLDSADRFDDLLLGVARRGRFACRIGDAYARWFTPWALLRRKLVLLLAILECTYPYSDLFDETPECSLLELAFKGFGAMFMSAVCLLIGVLLLHPMRVWLSRTRRNK